MTTTYTNFYFDIWKPNFVATKNTNNMIYDEFVKGPEYPGFQCTTDCDNVAPDCSTCGPQNFPNPTCNIILSTLDPIPTIDNQYCGSPGGNALYKNVCSWNPGIYYCGNFNSTSTCVISDSVTGSCSSLNYCPPNQTKINGVCTPITYCNNGTCPTGQQCEGTHTKVCLPICNDITTCPPGYNCLNNVCYISN